MTAVSEVRQAAEAWLDWDPDPQTRAQVQSWLDSGDQEALRAAFGSTLTFGTGGLRGEMGAGTSRMNRLMMRRAAGAWIDALLQIDPSLKERGVALAYDGRHLSRVFADDVARVVVGRGVGVWFATELVPTPVLSYAIRHLGCAAGAIVTASHNPPADNGFKVFDALGAQILSPLDRHVAERMAGLADPGPLADEGDARIRPWPASVRERYLSEVLALRSVSDPGSVRIAYTPLHGVGGAWTPEALCRAGHQDVHPVPSQIDPDGAFPTVAFPNPEEAGALDELVAHASSVGAQVGLANDPDADRVAVVVLHGGAWVTLSGNEVGALLAEALLSRSEGPHRLVATTIVSTQLLSALAAHHGARCVETLTGFKWIAQAALAHERDGGAFLFGMEESIGYTVGSLVRDKDGVSAAVLIADRAAELAAEGRTLVDALEALFERHGRHVCETRSVRLPGLDGQERIQAAMSALRADPPWELGGLDVAEVWDLASGIATARQGTTRAVDLPGSDVMGFVFEGAGRAWVRPSGTEPKIKFYVEVVVGGSREEGLEQAARVHAALAARAGLDA